mmetsp:Transcript_1743/g.5492  ORF Transcript_1743/g.5492 Transcript_1743/m.5492 type:complete len:354 (+) Transcript_1743:1482-2543(+)
MEVSEDLARRLHVRQNGLLGHSLSGSVCQQDQRVQVVLAEQLRQERCILVPRPLPVQRVLLLLQDGLRHGLRANHHGPRPSHQRRVQLAPAALAGAGAVQGEPPHHAAGVAHGVCHRELLVQQPPHQDAPQDHLLLVRGPALPPRAARGGGGGPGAVGQGPLGGRPGRGAGGAAAGARPPVRAVARLVLHLRLAGLARVEDVGKHLAHAHLPSGAVVEVVGALEVHAARGLLLGRGGLALHALTETAQLLLNGGEQEQAIQRQGTRVWLPRLPHRRPPLRNLVADRLGCEAGRCHCRGRSNRPAPTAVAVFAALAASRLGPQCATAVPAALAAAASAAHRGHQCVACQVETLG